MKKRTTMLMSALFAAGAFALNGNVAKADNVQAVNNNNANSTEVKQNTVNADSSKLNVASAQASNQADTKIPSKEQLKDTAMKQWNEAKKTVFGSGDYKVAVYDKYENGMSVFADGQKLIEPKQQVEESQIKNYDWSSVNNQISTAKEKINTYLDKDVENDTSALEGSRKEATESLKNIDLPTTGDPITDGSLEHTNKDMKNAYTNGTALAHIWNTIENPYLANLLGARQSIENSEYKNEEGVYSNKLAELVARNVRKDKDWVLTNTNPKTMVFGTLGENPDGSDNGVDTDNEQQKNVLPYFIYNKELLKADRDAYNRNNDIKSNENTSDNKNQSTTDTKKDQASQNVTDNATSKKDQSSEKVTNDTTSKKDQSTSSTSSSNTNQTTESNSSTTSSKTTSDTKNPVAKNEGSNTKTTDVVKSENKASENTASVIKNDAKAATEKTTDVKVVAPAKNASNEGKTTDAAAKASDAHVVALNSKVNAGTTSTTPAAAKGSQSKATENKLPQAGTDEKISLFASLAGLSIASLGLGALGASKKRKND